MPGIIDIAQIGVAVGDRVAWETFASEVLGFPTFRSDDGKLTYCRIDGYHHRLALADGPQPNVRYVAFDVGDGAALNEWEASLTSRGVACRRVDATECARRHVASAIELRDPDGHGIV